MLGMAHCQNGTGSLAHHFFGDASQEHMGQAAVAVRAHDDQIDVVFSGKQEDLIVGGSLAHRTVDRQTLQMVLLDLPLQSRTDGRRELLDVRGDGGATLTASGMKRARSCTACSR